MGRRIVRPRLKHDTNNQAYSQSKQEARDVLSIDAFLIQHEDSRWLELRDFVTISSIEIIEQVGVHSWPVTPSGLAATIFAELSRATAEYFLPEIRKR